MKRKCKEIMTFDFFMPCISDVTKDCNFSLLSKCSWGIRYTSISLASVFKKWQTSSFETSTNDILQLKHNWWQPHKNSFKRYSSIILPLIPLEIMTLNTHKYLVTSNYPNFPRSATKHSFKMTFLNRCFLNTAWDTSLFRTANTVNRLPHANTCPQYSMPSSLYMDL